MQEVKNAVDQAMREVANRFDFKNSVSDIRIEEGKLRLTSDDEFRMKQLIEILQGKLTRREVSLLALDYGKVEPAAKGTVRQEIGLKQGVDADTGRKIVRLIKDTGLKVQTQVQGEQVRVTGKSKDDLQKVQQLLRGKTEELGVALQFVNYR
jgi:cyclic-di-GMP-binding protein